MTFEFTSGAWRRNTSKPGEKERVLTTKLSPEWSVFVSNAANVWGFFRDKRRPGSGKVLPDTSKPQIL
jgi:hypothetical protein